MEHVVVAWEMEDGKLQLGTLQDEGRDHWKDLDGKGIELWTFQWSK